MQKTASTIVIAFLAGIIVAGGTAYIVSSLHRDGVTQPSRQLAQVQTPAVPVAPPPAAQEVNSAAAPAQPMQQPAHQQQSAVAKPAPEKTTVARSRKPHPGVERRSAPQPEASADEASAAPQPAEPETPQNVPDETDIASNQPGGSQPAATGPSHPPEPDHALNPPPGTQTAPPPPRNPQTITLPAGTQLPVRVNETISTDTNYSGDAFTATLEKPVVMNGFVIADRGARVTGKVVQAEKAGRVKGVAALQLALTQLHTTDGQTVNIVTTPWDKRGASSKKGDTAKVAGGAALGAIIGAIAGGGRGAAIGAGAGGAAGTGVVLTQRGKSATVPSETRLIFTLDNPVTITERL
jgi:hypothetical protein